MPTRLSLEVQGHRGARGLLPENTLPSFEIALDLGVSSIETDVHLTRDDVVVLVHDAHLTSRVCPTLADNQQIAVRSLTLADLRAYRVDGGTPPAPTPAAQRFARERGIDPYGIPSLVDFLDFVAFYAISTDKTPTQQARARSVILDIELKRVPFNPELIGDGYTGRSAGILEQRVVDAIRQAGLRERARVRSFDHRSVRAIKQLEPALRTGILTYATVPVAIDSLLTSAQAELYCPDYLFVDAEVVRQVHEGGMRILPYTINTPAAWERLLAWGVDGITTDYPDRLLTWLAERGIAVT